MVTSCEVCRSKTCTTVRYDQHVSSSDYRSRLISLVKRVRRHVYFLSAPLFRLGSRFIPRPLVTLLVNPFGGLVVVCTECGHGRLKAIPSTSRINSYYGYQYWQTHSEWRTDTTHYAAHPRAVGQSEFIWPHLKNLKDPVVLDIGAGHAYAILVLRDKLKAVGSLADLRVCESGEQWEAYYKTHGIVRDARHFPFESSSEYDYIHTSHWLEHVADLCGAVEKIESLMKPGSLLYVEVPNTEHDYWNQNHLDTPHIQFFTSDSLQRCFENVGLTTKEIAVFGPSNLDRARGSVGSEPHRGQNERGCWIRALFQKS